MLTFVQLTKIVECKQGLKKTAALVQFWGNVLTLWQYLFLVRLHLPMKSHTAVVKNLACLNVA